MAYPIPQADPDVYQDMLEFGFPIDIAHSVARKKLGITYVPLFKEMWAALDSPEGLRPPSMRSSKHALGRGEAAVTYVMLNIKHVLFSRKAGHNEVRWFKSEEMANNWFSALVNAPGLSGSIATSKSALPIGLAPRKAKKQDLQRGKLSHTGETDVDYSKAKVTVCPSFGYIKYVPGKSSQTQREGSDDFLNIRSKGW